MKYFLKCCAIALASFIGFCLITIYILFNTQIVVNETILKYVRAPKKYPDLNYITVNDLGEMLKNDTADYKIIKYTPTLYNSTDVLYADIKESLIPKWRELDTTRVSLYLVVENCGMLAEINNFARKNNIGNHIFVIRDNSKEFRSYGHLFPNVNGNRLTKILRTVVPTENTFMITCGVSYYNSVVLDRHNNMKLIQLFDKSPRSPNSYIVPMSFETIENLDSLDFNEIDELVLTNENMGTFYCNYFEIEE